MDRLKEKEIRAEVRNAEEKMEHIDKERESIAEEKKTILNTPHYAVEVKETEEGVIIDVFHRHGDLIESYTFWNDDVISEVE